MSFYHNNFDIHLKVGTKEEFLKIFTFISYINNSIFIIKLGSNYPDLHCKDSIRIPLQKILDIYNPMVAENTFLQNLIFPIGFPEYILLTARERIQEKDWINKTLKKYTTDDKIFNLLRKAL